MPKKRTEVLAKDMVSGLLMAFDISGCVVLAVSMLSPRSQEDRDGSYALSFDEMSCAFAIELALAVFFIHSMIILLDENQFLLKQPIDRRHSSEANPPTASVLLAPLIEMPDNESLCQKAWKVMLAFYVRICSAAMAATQPLLTMTVGCAKVDNMAIILLGMSASLGCFSPSILTQRLTQKPPLNVEFLSHDNRLKMMCFFSLSSQYLLWGSVSIITNKSQQVMSEGVFLAESAGMMVFAFLFSKVFHDAINVMAEDRMTENDPVLLEAAPVRISHCRILAKLTGVESNYSVMADFAVMFGCLANLTKTYAFLLKCLDFLDIDSHPLITLPLCVFVSGLNMGDILTRLVNKAMINKEHQVRSSSYLMPGGV